MTPDERASLLKNLTESRERLIGAVRGLSSEQRRYRTAPDRWSYGEIVEHLTTVEGAINGMVENSLAAAPDFSRRPAMTDEALIADVAGRITRFKAPEFLTPTGQYKDDELLRGFEAARQRTYDFARTTDADLRHHFATHPVLGELDCYQWLMLLAAHCDRHIAQGEEVRADAGFPKAAAAR